MKYHARFLVDKINQLIRLICIQQGSWTQQRLRQNYYKKKIGQPSFGHDKNDKPFTGENLPFILVLATRANNNMPFFTSLASESLKI
jgi:hypothetical protein